MRIIDRLGGPLLTSLDCGPLLLNLTINAQYRPPNVVPLMSTHYMFAGRFPILCPHSRARRELHNPLA